MIALYERNDQGFATLRIENGRLDLGSVLAAPLGVGCAVPVERYRSDSNDGGGSEA
jgi:hypothetical protein